MVLYLSIQKYVKKIIKLSVVLKDRIMAFQRCPHLYPRKLSMTFHIVSRNLDYECESNANYLLGNI